MFLVLWTSDTFDLLYHCMRYSNVKRLGTFNWNISDSPQPRQKGRLNTIERLYSMVSLLKKKNNNNNNNNNNKKNSSSLGAVNRIIMIHISNKSWRYLLAPLADGNLRGNLELPEEDHVLVTMESEYASSSSQSKMGRDSRHQDSTVINLRGLTVDCNWHWEPDTAFRGTIGAGFTLNKVKTSIGHVSGLITTGCTVGPKQFQ